MSKILMSIKPRYSKQIIEGSKKYEFRKRIPKKQIKTIVIYSSSPEKKIIGEIEVESILCESPKELWKKTKGYGGISYKEFMKYFLKKEKGYAYKIKSVKSYSKPLALIDLNVATAPQSFLYLN